MSDLEDQDVPSSDENSELDAESSDDTNLGKILIVDKMVACRI